ncbi:hypothetical protein SAMD00023353_9500100 [Rosellinia necatrix]|uniref:Uncharacterized protein n=1 Tax=Rosellinia necatrix TaxID=77044 RepID=A0A1W2TVZ2_ROSNE|nr:hypothetical protein SAMD00023353_9500100 [Rosellinia necatrix]
MSQEDLQDTFKTEPLTPKVLIADDSSDLRPEDEDDLQDIFETEPLNPTLLTVDETGDFLLNDILTKSRRGKPVGKRELAQKLYSASIVRVYERAARPPYFHESNLVPPRVHYYEAKVGLKNRRRRRAASAAQEGYRFWAGQDLEDGVRPRLKARSRGVLSKKKKCFSKKA